MVTDRRLLFCGAAIVFLLVATDTAHAQTSDVLDQIVGQFKSRSAGWEATLRSFALNTFGILAAIELAWAAFKLAFRGADVSEWLAEMVNQILFLGFFLALLQNSVTWGTAIVNSFRQAGSAAGGTGIAPSDVFASGVNLAQKVISQISVWAPTASVGLDHRRSCHRGMFRAHRGIHGARTCRELPRDFVGRAFDGVRRIALDERLCRQHNPLHHLGWREAVRAAIAGQHWERTDPEWAATFNDMTARRCASLSAVRS